MKDLELDVQGKDEDILVVTPPSFRGDLEREIDLIEEIARIDGYEKIPLLLPKGPVSPEERRRESLLERKAMEVFFQHGYYEVISYSFTSPTSWDFIGLTPDDPRRKYLRILNPLTEDFSVMRTSLIPGLMEAARYNISWKNTHLRIFELKKGFSSSGRRNSGGTVPRRRLPGQQAGGLHAVRSGPDTTMHQGADIDSFDQPRQSCGGGHDWIDVGVPPDTRTAYREPRTAPTSLACRRRSPASQAQGLPAQVRCSVDDAFDPVAASAPTELVVREGSEVRCPERTAVWAVGEPSPLGACLRVHDVGQALQVSAVDQGHRDGCGRGRQGVAYALPLDSGPGDERRLTLDPDQHLGRPAAVEPRAVAGGLADGDFLPADPDGAGDLAEVHTQEPGDQSDRGQVVASVVLELLDHDAAPQVS